MDLTRDLSWWESDRKWMKKLRKIFFFHLKHRVIFNEDLNCNLHIGSATVWSYLKQIGRKGSKLCQKRFMQICPILSPNYLFNMPTQSHGGRERPTGRGNLLMNRASEGGGEVSWSLPGPEIWQLWEILQFSDKKGTRRCDWRRRTHQTWDLSKNLHDQIFAQKNGCGGRDKSQLWDPPRNISEIDRSPISANLLAISGHRMRTGRPMKTGRSLNTERQDHDLQSPKKTFSYKPSRSCWHFIEIHWTEPVVSCIGV